jgi:hypothetical protein
MDRGLPPFVVKVTAPPVDTAIVPAVAPFFLTVNVAAVAGLLPTDPREPEKLAGNVSGSMKVTHVYAPERN